MRGPSAFICLATIAGAACSDGAPIDPGTHTGPDAGPPSARRLISPDFGPAQESDPVPPPISGGTMIIARDGRTAIAADPDRDLAYVVDLDLQSLRKTIALDRSDEPGRLTEDAAKRIHVVLRRGGAIATIDPDSGAVIERRAVCANPRGIAYDEARDLLHVACRGGELISLPAAGGTPARRIRLEPDLRDVIVDGDRLWVSVHRAARILVLDADGARTGEISLPDYYSARTGRWFKASLLTRLVARPGGGLVALHQRAATEPIVLENLPGQAPDPQMPVSGALGYIGFSTCETSAVHTTITLIDRDGRPDLPGPLDALLVTADLAVDANGWTTTTVSPGVAGTGFQARQFFVASGRDASCEIGGVISGLHGDGALFSEGELTSVAIAPDGTIVVFGREPAALRLYNEFEPGYPRRIDLDSRSVAHLGHAIFHRNAGGNIACASCHAEANDDGHTWLFEGVGPRRTQPLRIGLLDTAPYHWNGEFADLRILLDDVFQHRMGGPRLSELEAGALGRWLHAQPPLRPDPPLDPGAVERGKTVFEREGVGCSSCHLGPRLTDNRSVDVGTGGLFQVPSLLGVVHRAPYMHDGCARDLRDRFRPECGGDKHGDISALTEQELADLLAYLESL